MSERTTDRLGEALDEIEALRLRAENAERELAEANMVLGSLSTLIDDGIAAREKLAARAEKAEAERDQLRAELERVKAERVWTTPEDRQG